MPRGMSRRLSTSAAWAADVVAVPRKATKRNVILFLNGPFGIGKTTTAHLLVERLPGALLYDPELVEPVMHFSATIATDR